MATAGQYDDESPIPPQHGRAEDGHLLGLPPLPPIVLEMWNMQLPPEGQGVDQGSQLPVDEMDQGEMVDG